MNNNETPQETIDRIKADRLTAQLAMFPTPRR